jgi:MFS family permease
MPAIAKQFDLNSNAVKFVAVAIGLIGYIAGSNIIGLLADRRGRRVAFVISLIVSGLGSLGCAFATGVVTLSIWRFVTGMGVGAALNLATTYVGEFSPPSQRGRISVQTFMIGIIGQAVTPFVALGLVPNFEIGWRLLFLIGALVGLAGVLFGLRLPESPRWLIEHGRPEKAEALIWSMEQRFDPEDLAASAARCSARRAVVPGPLLAGEPEGTPQAREGQCPASIMHELLHERSWPWSPCGSCGMSATMGSWGTALPCCPRTAWGSAARSCTWRSERSDTRWERGSWSSSPTRSSEST